MDLNVVKAIYAWGKKHLSAAQVCWICIFGSAGIVILVTTKYAKATDLQAVRLDVADVRLYLLQKDIIDTRVIQCTSVSGFKEWYAKRIGELELHYSMLNPSGAEFTLPDCKDL